MHPAVHLCPLPCAACSFPFFSMGVLLPCALLAALGVKVLLTASVLVGWEVVDSLNLIWTQARQAAAWEAAERLHGEQPSRCVGSSLAAAWEAAEHCC